MDHDQESHLIPVRVSSGKLGSWLNSVSEGELKRIGELTCYREGVEENSIPVSAILSGHSDSLQQLTHITLSHCGVSTTELVALVNLFPNLNSIYLKYPFPLCDSNQQISLTRQDPLEMLRITNEHTIPSNVLDEWLETELRFNKIVFEAKLTVLVSAKFVNAVLRAFGAGAETLESPVTYTGMCDL